MDDNKRQTYYYVTSQSTKLGKELARIDRRCHEAMIAAEKLAIEKNADEFCVDSNFYAGGIWRFIFNGKLKAKKSFMVVAQDKDGNYLCAPNQNYNCGLRLAKKVAALPHVTYKEVYEAFGIDHRFAKDGYFMPWILAVGAEWVYVRSSFDLAALCPDLNACSEETFAAALRFIEEHESPTLSKEA